MDIIKIAQPSSMTCKASFNGDAMTGLAAKAYIAGVGIMDVPDCCNTAAYKVTWKGCQECRLQDTATPMPTDPYLASIYRQDVDELQGHPACGREEYICQDCMNITDVIRKYRRA